MSSQIAKLTGAWSTDVLPTQTTLTHIDPAAITGLISTLISASNAYPTITKNIDLYDLAREVKGAQASLKVISAQHYIATATATQNFPQMTSVIWNATMELQDLEMGFNLYQMELSTVANVLFAVIFAILLATHTGLFLWKHYLYFGICFFLGTGLELAGYVARVMAIGHYSEKNPFLCQIICLTLAPALIMAGIYYLLAQLSVIYGRQFSRLKPLWFSYIFIFCDISSLLIQAAGGGLAAIRLQRLESTTTGTHIMLTGIAFQVLSMTLFLWFLFEFLWRIYFRASPNVKFSVGTFFSLLFQTKNGRILQNEHLFAHYNPKYSHIWSRRLFGYYPLAIILGVAFIYIRCVYRLVELSEGWTGYLITHEDFVMTLDGLQVLLTCILFIPFHPGFIMGKGANVSLSSIKENTDVEAQTSYVNSPSNSSNVSSSFDEKFSNQDTESYNSGNGHDYDTQVPMNPYFVPKIAVAPPPVPQKMAISSPNVSQNVANTANVANVAPEQLTRTHTRATENSMASQFPQTPEPKQHRHKWFGLIGESSKAKKMQGDDIVAIPYTHTSEGGQMIEPPSPLQQKTRNKKKFDKPARILETDSVASYNPYTRSIEQEDLGTSGPYEQNFESPATRPNSDQYPSSNYYKSWQGGDNASQVSDDEFLFTFGK